MALRRLAVLVVILVGALVQYGCRKSPDAPPSPVVVEEYTSFTSPHFSFPYPANWKTMDAGDVQSLVDTNITPLGVGGDAIDWAGGVYTGCSDPSRCDNAASIFAVVVRMSGFPGSMSDEQFSQFANNMESASQQSFGTRLRSFDRLSVSSFRAIAVTALARSGKQVIRNVTIFASQDSMYLVFCGASQNLFDSYVKVFDNIIEQMEVKID